MRSLGLALLELRRVTATHRIRAAICIVALVPLLYGGLYLWAFWDPYSNLDKLPVAVVNLDQAVTSNGRQIHAGADLVGELNKSKSLKWEAVSSAEAQNKLTNGKIQVVLTIPADFSTSVASASGNSPKKAALQVTDRGTNILVSQITERVLSEVKNAVSQKVSATYLDNVYVSMSDLHDGLVTAADSATQLSSGMSSAANGAKQLQHGLTKAGSGASQLSSGIKKLQSGSATLASGSSSVASGTDTLARKLSTATSGAGTLATGTSSAASGASTLASGMSKLESGGGTLKKSVSQLSTGAEGVSSGASQLATAIGKASAAGSQVAQGAAQLDQLLDALAAAHPELSSDSTFVQARAAGSQVSTGAAQLAAGLTTASQSAKTLAEGAASVSNGASALGSGVSSYVAGVQTASTSAGQLSAGLHTLSSGSQTLASGLSKAQSGVSSLAAGSAQVASGARTLSAGVSSANSGAKQLSSALGTLTVGSSSLGSGILSGADGAGKLAAGLSDSVSQVPNYSSTQRAAHTEVMSSPVTTNSKTLHKIPNYGTGFAPYFIPLALWVGALMAYFIVRAIGSRALSSNTSNLTILLSGYWPAAVATTIQSVIMMLALQFGLGLHPANVALAYLFVIFVALVFTAIMQFLSGALGTAGKFVAIVLLMLQLTSSAGTFPLETISHFFQAINPYLPMTYVVLGLRQVVSIGDMGELGRDVAVLLGFGCVAMVATYVTVRRRRTWTMGRLKPEVSV